MILRTENLKYTYSKNSPFEKTAVDDISVEFKEGGFYGVIGHTGSGKSTFIQHLNGLIKPTSGKVFFNNKDIWENDDVRKLRFRVGLVFQYPEYQLFEETVYKDIAYGPKNMGLSESEIDKNVRDAMEFVGLDFEISKKSPFELSGGQKRRVAIAGVLAMKPDVLILDEPTAGLDPKGRDNILNKIKEYHKEVKNTVILVSHSMEDIAKFCEDVLVFNKSKLFMFSKVSDVFLRAEELSKIGLSIPQVTKVFLKLREKGFEVDNGVYTIENAVNEIIKYKESGGKRHA